MKSPISVLFLAGLLCSATSVAYADQSTIIPESAGTEAPGAQGSAVIDLAQKKYAMVQLDRAQLISLPEGVSTLIFGNPAIVDITTLPNRLGVLTGKSFGTTNLIALNESGAVLFEAQLDIVAPKENTIIVTRGFDRETYSCQPTCQPVIKLGDSSKFFGDTSGQTTARNTLMTPVK